MSAPTLMLGLTTVLSLLQIATGFSNHAFRPCSATTKFCRNESPLPTPLPSSCSASLERRDNQQTICWAQVGDDEEDEEDLMEKEFMGLQSNGNGGNNKEGGGENNPQQQKPAAAKGKGRKGIKKPLWPHDDRDKLPFLVQVMTPPDDILEQKLLEEKRKKKNKLKKKYRRKGMVYHDNDDNDGEVVGETLGEYTFEKNTSSGDKIEIDEQVYLVTKAKCQYRYAGNQQFEMVRKILQVKPVQRAMQEDYIMRQFNAPSAQESE